MNAVELRDVHRRYRLAGVEVSALRDVTLDVPRGKLAAIVGRSGSGKSTLLNLVAGIDRPSAGRITVEGRDISGLSSDQLAQYRRETVGVIFQSFNLIASMNALENVAFPLAFGGVTRAERAARARDALARVGLDARVHHRPAELSGGEQQRVAIARALVARPRLLLADEPTGNLDSDNAEAILRDIRALVDDEGISVLLVTHDADAAARYSDLVVAMSNGQIGDVSETR